VAFNTGKRCQKTCDEFLVHMMDRMELPMPDNQLEIYTDGNPEYINGIAKMYAHTCYSLGQLIKVKENGRLKKISRRWINGQRATNQIHTSQIENINGIARGTQSHLVRKTKNFAKHVRRIPRMYELFQVYRNFIRVDKTKQTPAMKEGLCDHPISWSTFFHSHYQT